MKKRSKKKRSKVPTQSDDKRNESVKDSPADDEGSNTNYGGIPAMDLKKNLGCG